MAGPLRIDEIDFIQKRYPLYKYKECFIETGTYLGRTIFPMSQFFQKLHTVELSEKHYKNAIATAKDKRITNIQFHFGDSKEIIPLIIRDANSPSIFFLDGHFCGVGTDSAESNIPLFEELKFINYLRNNDDIIIIDDYELFGQNVQNMKLDWSNVTEKNILDCFERKKIFAHFVRNDRFWLLLKKI